MDRKHSSFTQQSSASHQPAYWVTGEGAPDFRPSQWIHCAEQDDSYMDPEVTFNNLYKE
jgi:hypothetical protein